MPITNTRCSFSDEVSETSSTPATAIMAAITAVWVVIASTVHPEPRPTHASAANPSTIGARSSRSAICDTSGLSSLSAVSLALDEGAAHAPRSRANAHGQPIAVGTSACSQQQSAGDRERREQRAERRHASQRPLATATAVELQADQHSERSECRRHGRVERREHAIREQIQPARSQCHAERQEDQSEPRGRGQPDREPSVGPPAPTRRHHGAQSRVERIVLEPGRLCQITPHRHFSMATTR